MNYRHRWLAMVAVAAISLTAASSALAVSVNPFSPSVADIQALADQTSGFSNGNQLSTIDSITVEPNGVRLNVTWRVGQNSDPFGADFGETFARVVVSRFTNGEDPAGDPPVARGRLLNPSYDGIKWNIQSDQALSGQPFLQTAPNWLYYQPPATIPVPGDSSVTPVTIAFDDAQEFDGGVPDTGVVNPDVNGEIRSNSFGLQFYAGFGLTVGQPVQGQIWISNPVPEPASAALLLVGLVGLLGRKRR
jgi:hypothetical protein